MASAPSGEWARASPRSCPRPAPAGRSCSICPVDKIEPNPDQPRSSSSPGRCKALADSIAATGLLQPLIVRPLDDGGGRYELVAGERRWRAAQQAGLEDRPGRGPRPGRGRAPAGGADREHGPRGPQPGRRGARLRRAGRRPRHLQGGARPPRRPQPRRDLEPDPDPRPPRRGAGAARRAASSARATAAPSCWSATRASAASSPAAPPATAGRCARPRSAPRRSRLRARCRSEAGRPPTSGRPDQEAEDALGEALGADVKVRAAKQGIKAEIEFDGRRRATQNGTATQASR